MASSNSDAARSYFSRLLEITTDLVLIDRVEELATEERYDDIAHEARVRAWRLGHRPRSCRWGEKKHELFPEDTQPAGKVWFHDGTWWTFTRRQWGRVERRFDERSNPLDHEEVLDYEIPILPPTRRVYREVEY